MQGTLPCCSGGDDVIETWRRSRPSVDAEPSVQAEAVPSHAPVRSALVAVAVDRRRDDSEAHFLSLSEGVSGVQNRRRRIRNRANVATRCSHGAQKCVLEAAS